MKALALTTTIAATLAGAAFANEFEPVMRDYLSNQVVSWASDPVLIEAIRSQNSQTSGYSSTDIETLDQTWRAEIGSAETPTMSPVLENAASDFLRARVADSGGAITEVFIMDAQGLNVAASDATSDYWQGDEAKFIETFGIGPGAMHVGDVEFDESSQRYQGQVSMTLVDPVTKTPIGALTVGLDAEALF